MLDKQRKEVEIVATISSIFALRTCGIAMRLQIYKRSKYYSEYNTFMNRGIIYVINHVLCLFTRFHPLFSDKKASKVLMNVFFLPPSLLPFNFQFFVSTHFIIMILKLGIQLKGKQIIVIVVNVHIQLLFVGIILVVDDMVLRI